jgi:hypothetical protein
MFVILFLIVIKNGGILCEMNVTCWQLFLLGPRCITRNCQLLLLCSDILLPMQKWYYILLSTVTKSIEIQ